MIILIKNRRAPYEYHILESFESGIVLKGTEVKSVKQKKISFAEAYCILKNRELWLHSCHISPYSHDGYSSHDPWRLRKLLLHRSELRKISRETKLKGMSIIPLAIGLSKKGLIKIEIALCRGKRLYQKRQTIRERDILRDTQRELKAHE